jgi:hypothetical protein
LPIFLQQAATWKLAQSKKRKARKTDISRRFFDVLRLKFRNNKENLVFQLNADLNSVSEDDIKKQGGKKATLPCLVGPRWLGVELSAKVFLLNFRL